MSSLEQLTQEILALPNTERVKLTDILIESLDFDLNSETQAVWKEEAKKRRQDILSGNVQPIDGETALAQVRQLLGVSY